MPLNVGEQGSAVLTLIGEVLLISSGEVLTGEVLTERSSLKVLTGERSSLEVLTYGDTNTVRPDQCSRGARWPRAQPVRPLER